jgi:CheY-like chemotaxis protein
MPTILVVDDSAVDRRLAGGLLQRLPDSAIQYAETAAEALALMQSQTPDVVVADLVMPEQDGLELLNAVRENHANTPVILVTAHGSETLAVEALERGAAAYVPKSQLSERLVDAVDEVLAMAHANRDYARLLRFLDYSEAAFHLENDLALLDPLVDLVQQLLSAVDFCDATERFRIGVAFKEALMNACYHGNLEIGFQEGSRTTEYVPVDVVKQLIDRRRAESPYRERKIHVGWNIRRDRVRFVVRDEGPGFDVQAAWEGAALDAPDVVGGRGLVLMRAFMDQVDYNTRGTEVTMIKYGSSRA